MGKKADKVKDIYREMYEQVKAAKDKNKQKDKIEKTAIEIVRTLGMTITIGLSTLGLVMINHSAGVDLFVNVPISVVLAMLLYIASHTEEL